MYNAFRSWAERLLRIPPMPEAPPGDEHAARVFTAAPNFYKYLFVLWGFKTLAAFLSILPMLIVPLIIAMKAKAKHDALVGILFTLPAFAVGAVIVLRLFALALVRLDFEQRWYVVTDRSLRVREGILNVREMTVTFANIQNISISQGPIQRAIGIADLRVDTAGGGGSTSDKKESTADLHTAWFRGIDNADQIRSLIQARLHALKDAGLGDRDDVARPAVAFDVQTPELVTALRGIADEAAALRVAVAMIGA